MWYGHNVFPPAGIFCISAVEAFLSAVINDTNSSTVHFKLSPAYALYAVARFALQQRRRGSNTPSVTSVTNQMVNVTRSVIQASQESLENMRRISAFQWPLTPFASQKQQAIAGALAFWMANSSELLNFFKCDKDLDPLTQPSQQDLSHLVHEAHR